MLKCSVLIPLAEHREETPGYRKVIITLEGDFMFPVKHISGLIFLFHEHYFDVKFVTQSSYIFDVIIGE